jgi:hypothetical protein
MDCFCCRENVAQGRHLKLRGDVRKGFQIAHLDEAAYIAYQEDTTYRSSFVCEGCYGVLDSSDGTGTIQGSSYGIAGASRGNKVSVRRKTSGCRSRGHHFQSVFCLGSVRLLNRLTGR